MDIKNINKDLAVVLWVAFLIYLIGTTYLMIDIQKRLGFIEHYIAHQIRSQDSEFYCSEIDKK